MWERYVPDDLGIAVVSTVERLRGSLGEYRLESNYGEEPIFVGAVHYVDYAVKDLCDEGERARFLHKRIEYQDEAEIRAVLSLRVPSEFNVRVPENGTFVDVDVSTLISEVRVQPNGSRRDLREVQGVTRAAGGRCHRARAGGKRAMGSGTHRKRRALRSHHHLRHKRPRAPQSKMMAVTGPTSHRSGDGVGS